VTPDELREKRRKEAERLERLEAEWDEQDAVVNEGSEVTLRAELVASRIYTGTASLAEIQEVLDVDTTNPYADVSSVTLACMFAGLDATTGRPLAS
jgi:hypothetical protein